MLLLMRPRQTYLPYALPRHRMEQSEYNRQLQAQFEATVRVKPTTPADEPTPTLSDRLKELAGLHDSGALTDEEFAAAKAKVLGS